MITTSSIKLIYSQALCANSSGLSAIFMNILKMIQASFQISSFKSLSSRTLYVILSMLILLKIYFLFSNDFYFKIIKIIFKNAKNIFFHALLLINLKTDLKNLYEKKVMAFFDWVLIKRSPCTYIHTNIHIYIPTFIHTYIHT